jgi:uncharacterized protein YukE
MTESLSVNPDDLRTAAANVADISSEMKQVLSALKGQLAALGSPWGNDSTGDQFANGSNGYLAQVDTVDGSIDATTRQLDSLSQSLTSAASNFEHQDQPPSGGTGNVLLNAGSGGSGGAGQVQTTSPPPSTPGVALERSVLRRTAAVQALLPETPGVPAQPAQPAAAGAGNGSAQLSASEGLALSPALPRIPAQPAQPAIPAGNVLAGGSPAGAGALGELSPVLRGTPEVPAVAAVPAGGTQPANPIAPEEILSAIPTQPATAPNLLTSGVESGATSPSTPAASPMTPAVATPARPATTAGNILASVTPGAEGSTPGSGISALIQAVEQLAQPAGEGVSAAMGAVQSGKAGSGTPGGPAST